MTPSYPGPSSEFGKKLNKRPDWSVSERKKTLIWHDRSTANPIILSFSYAGWWNDILVAQKVDQDSSYAVASVVQTKQ